MSKESELNAMFELIAQIQTLQLVMNAKVVAYLREASDVPPPEEMKGDAPPVEPSPTPVFAAPPFAAQEPHPIPFSNPQELMDYVMGVYEKSQDQMKTGAAIQGVLKDLGALQLSDVNPAQYALLFQRIEALK